MSLMRLLTSGKTLIGLQDTRPHYRMADPRSMPVFGSPKSSFRKKAEAARAEAKELAEKISAAGMCQPELQGPNNLEEVRPDRESDGIRRCDGPLNPSLSLSAAQSEVKRGTEGERENLQGEEERLQDHRTSGQQDCGQKAESKKVRTGVAKAEIEETTTKTEERRSEGVVEVAKQGPARADGRFAWFSDWAERVGSLLPMRPRPARSAARAIAPQQGELALSLDQVKVVRNDLSDCDVEFVAKKQKTEMSKPDRPKQKLDNGTTGLQDEESVESREQNPEISGAGVAGETSLSNSAWGRATARLFGASFVRSANLVEKS